MTRRIAVVLPDLGGGGAERLHLNLARAWSAKGMHVDFVLMRASGALRALVPASVGVIDLQVGRIRSAFNPLRSYLAQRRPDVTLAAMWPLTSLTALAWTAAGSPGRLFLSDHTQLSISRVHETRSPLWAMRASLASTYRLATGVVAVSQGVKNDLCSLGALPEDHVRVIYNPAAVETVLVSRSDGQGLWQPSAKRRILTAGSLKEQKDHRTLIRAFAALPLDLGAELVILGDGPLMAELAALVVELGLQGRVRLPGFTADPYGWFRSADLFVLSSRWEGFANVIVEALSYGLPVVSTECDSGPSEILAHGRYGRLVPVRDAVALARAIQLALSESAPREALFRRSRDFTVEKISAQYLDFMFDGLPWANGRVG